MSESYLIEKNEQPTVGYKMVKLPNNMFGIAEMKIPHDANVVQTSYVVQYRGQTVSEKNKEHHLMRTDKVIVTSIKSLVGMPILYTNAFSIKNPKFKYTVGITMNENIKRFDTADGPGIHFFAEEKFAKMWKSLL